MTRNKNKKRSRFVKMLAAMVGFFVFGSILVIAFCFSSEISAETIADGDEVRQNTELTYYLTVHYDGVDKSGVESDDTTVADVRSGFISVTDTLPDGLVFVGFVTTDNGRIGAVTRNDDSVFCSGMVVDDTMEASLTTGTWNQGGTEYTYHGLHYNANTRTVSFKVKNLKAGCDLSVGIITRTPTLGGASRKDFYNTAYIKEGLLSNASNTVHTYMGDEQETLYAVTYSYGGTVPANAPALPAAQSYASSTSVGVATPPDVAGYTFSGWTTSDASINNGSFTMPSHSVSFVGTFTPQAETKYTVSYVLDADSETPDSFLLPRQKSYAAGEDVAISAPTVNDEIDGYIFEGWSSSDAAVVGATQFEMPAHSVVIVGSFREKTYKVSYAFSDRGGLPENASSLLPSDRYYSEGDIVQLASAPTANGYKFLGWFADDSFEMPAEDVTIIGEWTPQNGSFEPQITMTIIDQKTKYRIGDTVRFEISVTNNEDYAIKSVQVLEQLEGARFVTGNGYQILNDQYALIPTISAGNTVKLYAEYSIIEDVTRYLTNTVKLSGATADNNYYLDTNHNYVANAEFYSESWRDSPVLSGIKTNSTTLYAILTSIGGLGICTCVVKRKRKR